MADPMINRLMVIVVALAFTCATAMPAYAEPVSITALLVSVGTATLGAAGAGIVGATVTAAVGAATLAVGAFTLISTVRGLVSGPGQQGSTLPAVGGDEPFQHVVGRTLTSGVLVGRNSSGNDNRWLFESRVLSYGPIERIVEMRINNRSVVLEETEDDQGEGFEVDTRPWNDEIAYITQGLGLPGEPVDGMGQSFGGFSSTHRHQPFAYLNSRYRTASEWEGNVPRVTAIVDGEYIYDPRDPSHNPSNQLSWGRTSRNPALIAAWFVMQEWSYGDGFDAVDWDSVITAANICDETVSGSNGPERRYEMGGRLFENEDRKAQLEDIVRSMAGDFLPPKATGKWRFYAGAFLEPVIDFIEDDIIKCNSYNPIISKDRRPNHVSGVFQSRADNYQSIPYTTVIDQESIDKYGEVRSDLGLKYVQSDSQAQRIAKITINQGKYPITWSGPMKLIALAPQVGDRVRLTDRTKKLEGRTMLLTGKEFSQNGEIIVTMREDNEEIYRAAEIEQSTPTIPFNNNPSSFGF